MCGICGIINIDGKPVDTGILQRMNNAMQHRGPDDSGIHIEGNMGIAMRRLSIIDLGGGHQPIHNEDRQVWVVLNGEIYNYPALRKALESSGHRFYTHSDTETIVHLYEAHGVEFLQHLQGMFGLAVWDARKRQMVLARDRAGIKPLFYYRDANRLIFASELKSILQHPDVPKRIAAPALDAFFTCCFIPAPLTIYENIYKLLPGERLIWNDAGINLETWWQLSYAPDTHMGFDDAITGFRERFREAVRMRMISDVPLGAFLSGGIDSSAVVAMMSELSDKPVQTFSIGFEGNVGGFDETADARKIAKRFNTDHHELVVKPDLKEIGPWLAEFFDEPFSNSSAIPNYYVSKMAREKVTVALSGLGGDEIAVGYLRHIGLLMARYYRALPSFLRDKWVPQLANTLPDSARGKLFSERLKRFVRQGSEEAYQSYMSYMTYLADTEKQALYHADFYHAVNGFVDQTYRDYFNHHPEAHLVHRAAYTDLKIDLPENLLALTDRMSMAVSLEVRVPFLDHELMAFMARVPAEYKLKGTRTKHFLKKAMEGILPHEILYKKKQGFSIPLALWFRTELKETVSQVLSRERVERTGYLNYTAVRHILDQHYCGRENNYRQIWSFMVFVYWHEANFGARQDG